MAPRAAKKMSKVPSKAPMPGKGAAPPLDPLFASSADAVAWQGGPTASAKYAGREIQIWEQQAEVCSSDTTYRSDYNNFFVPAPVPSARPPRPMQESAPFNASTTYAEAYKAWPINRPKPIVPPSQMQDAREGFWESTHSAHYTKPMLMAKVAPIRPHREPYSSEPLNATTTYKRDYMAYPNCKAAELQKPKCGDMTPVPFVGSTTHSEHYPAWGHMPRVQRCSQPPAQSTSSAPLESMTTHRASYKVITLPPGAEFTLGVQVVSGRVGGKFHSMIKAGTRAPAKGQAMVTTVVDNQTSVEIVCIAKSPTKALELGHFCIGGVTAAPAGVIRVPLTFELITGGKLRVKAFEEGNTKGAQVWLGDLP